MLKHITNEFIALSLRLNQTQNEFDFGIHAVETENLLMPTILWRSNHWQLVEVVCGWISVLIGSYFRLIMYEDLIEQYKEKALYNIKAQKFISFLGQDIRRPMMTFQPLTQQV